MVVSDRWVPLAASVTLRSLEHDDEAHDAVTTASEADGRFEVDLPDDWDGIEISAESTDDLWAGTFERDLSQNQKDSERVDLGTLQLAFSPIVHIRLFIDDKAKPALKKGGISNLYVQVARPQDGQGHGILRFVPGPPHELHAFSVGQAGTQETSEEVSVRIPNSYIDNQYTASVALSIPYANPAAPVKDIIDKTRVDLLTESERHISFSIGPENALSGIVTINDKPADDFTISYLSRNTNTPFGEVKTAPDGTFVGLVKAGSHGTIWPGINGQSAQVEWSAGVPVELQIDTSSLLQVKVIDPSGQPVEDGLVAQTASSNWGHGDNPDSLRRRAPGGIFYIPCERIGRGQRLFVRVPGYTESMFAAQKDHARTDGPVIVKLGETTPATSSLLVHVRGEYARKAPGPLRVRLERLEEGTENNPIKYFFHPEGVKHEFAGLFSGRYKYWVRKNRDMIQSGDVVLSEDSCTSLEIDV